jgi:hypothetical protein
MFSRPVERRDLQLQAEEEACSKRKRQTNEDSMLMYRSAFNFMELANAGLDILNSRERAQYTHKKPEIYDWWALPWGQMLRDPALHDPESHQHRRFMSRYRLPFATFLDVVESARAAGVFGAEVNAAGRPAMPVEMKVLGGFQFVEN